MFVGISKRNGRGGFGDDMVMGLVNDRDKRTVAAELQNTEAGERCQGGIRRESFVVVIRLLVALERLNVIVAGG
jgi:hypothetical protein